MFSIGRTFFIRDRLMVHRAILLGHQFEAYLTMICPGHFVKVLHLKRYKHNRLLADSSHGLQPPIAMLHFWFLMGTDPQLFLWLSSKALTYLLFVF